MKQNEPRQCQYAQFSATQQRCEKPATRKFGDYWFCDEHGSRTQDQGRINQQQPMKNTYKAAAALLIELQRELRGEADEWRTKPDDPYNINYAISIACAVNAEAIERTLKTAVNWK